MLAHWDSAHDIGVGHLLQIEHQRQYHTGKDSQLQFQKQHTQEGHHHNDRFTMAAFQDMPDLLEINHTPSNQEQNACQVDKPPVVF